MLWRKRNGPAEAQPNTWRDANACGGRASITPATAQSLESLPTKTLLASKMSMLTPTSRGPGPAAVDRIQAASPVIYPESAGTRTNRLPKREIGILLTE
jgi:hypothetical protein